MRARVERSGGTGRPVALRDSRGELDGAVGLVGAVACDEDAAGERRLGNPARDQHGHARAVYGRGVPCRPARCRRHVTRRGSPRRAGPRAEASSRSTFRAGSCSRDDLTGSPDAGLARGADGRLDRLIRAPGGDRRLASGPGAALLAHAYEDQGGARTRDGDRLLDRHMRAAAAVDAADDAAERRRQVAAAPGGPEELATAPGRRFRPTSRVDSTPIGRLRLRVADEQVGDSVRAPSARLRRAASRSASPSPGRSDAQEPASRSAGVARDAEQVAIGDDAPGRAAGEARNDHGVNVVGRHDPRDCLHRGVGRAADRRPARIASATRA